LGPQAEVLAVRSVELCEHSLQTVQSLYLLMSVQLRMVLWVAVEEAVQHRNADLEVVLDFLGTKKLG
tara:strand:- start:250 stop:450 length:201 start_codon:yes stop_codon:yes gene_type:complete